MVTIKDIAKNLGVSYSTVSRCLNNDSTVSEKTREKVVAEAKRLGFSFNTNARNLVKKVTKTIGIILSNNFNEIDNRWFFNEILGHCIPSIEKHKYDFIIQTNETFYKESNILKLIKGNMVDGLIIVSKHITRYEYDFLNKNNIPYVLIYFKPLFEDGIPDNLFYDDNEFGGYIATKHLIEKGHSRVLTITSNDPILRMYNERTAGYMRAIKEYGLEPSIIECDHMSFEYQKQFLKRYHNIITSYPAIFAQQDLVALGLIQALDKYYQIKVPGDIDFVGYNNIDLIRYFDIPLTTVEDPRNVVINNAVDYLINRLNGILDMVPKNKLNPSLVIRD